MSDKMRWRYSDTNPVVAAVDSATEIEIGDLLYQEVDNAKPASALGGTDKANQQLFADNFLGVAMQRSPVGDADPIRVATTGVFELDCPSGTFELGDLVGVAAINLPPICLLDQQVAKVTTGKYAIGRVARRINPAATTALIDIRSTVMTGGVITR